MYFWVMRSLFVHIKYNENRKLVEQNTLVVRFAFPYPIMSIYLLDKTVIGLQMVWLDDEFKWIWSVDNRDLCRPTS